MYSLGYDLGSSSIKASVVDLQSCKPIAQYSYPSYEMPMISLRQGWAEQNPEDWWINLQAVTKAVIAESNIKADQIVSIGIAYQMHGLVAVDQLLKPVRPSIIWCDSRAVEYGNAAFNGIGEKYCLENYLNSPGNFTASKLAWVQKNEPDKFGTIYKIMLPGEYIILYMVPNLS
ncbi:MAG: FGGY family carbohydrate kinase, partial [Melioribacteraceae bacterium]|nr:FGGY family carbohydrate kinase [Melioribacteraceae bacterium]